ncbi:phosphatidylinositol mannoside acyltransferase [Pseudonocardia halophobica]|uniref:Lipid A biosynthesis lauroyl acyltransferase n=1 Tax=Pseudonocardia halophobica TaxID=29401 RepID=A0A9W6NX91_9PSEU|nr:phosphatidylinositol mannoside acyltransferase [Pseudonocardia halophobica]GLL13210.1 lipid A biosynthesis lauroyl acyltransferase [Pseudonocardia halophobica]
MTLAELGYTAAWRLLRHVPAPLSEAGFRAGADLAWRRGGAGVERLRGNLRRVRPAASEAELDRLVRAALRSYARYWGEAFRLPALDPATIHARHSTATGLDAAITAMQEGRGVVLALPHAGNWDVAGVYVMEELRRHGLPAEMTTVVERLRPESVYRRFVEYRESLGFEIVAQDDGRRAHLALTRRLRAGGLVCLIADRDLAGTGIDVPFFRDTIRLPSGPASLCALTGAQLHAAVTYFRPGGWGATVSPAIAVPDRAAVPKATLELARAFEEHIAAHLEDWHMLQELTPGSRR